MVVGQAQCVIGLLELPHAREEIAATRVRQRGQRALVLGERPVREQLIALEGRLHFTGTFEETPEDLERVLPSDRSAGPFLQRPAQLGSRAAISLK